MTGQFDLTGQPPALLCGLEIMGYFARINKVVIFDIVQPACLQVGKFVGVIFRQRIDWLFVIENAMGGVGDGGIAVIYMGKPKKRLTNLGQSLTFAVLVCG